MNKQSWAKTELELAGYFVDDPEDGPNKWLAQGTLELLEVFSEQGHSGMSAPYAINIFERLANWKPLTPLHGGDSEWNEVDENMWQNKRDSSVFKDKDNIAYWSGGRVFWEWFSTPEIDEGQPYKLYFTGSGSRINVIFPWVQPESPEYVFRPSIDYPNEVL